MCGLFLSNFESIDQRDFESIEKTLRFRGPDASNFHILKNGWRSYHSRLSIIATTADNNQPLINPDGSSLVFNGEIFNFKELGLKYFNKEYKSDTKLLNDLILKNKLDLGELDGFFAFVFISGCGEIVYAARDRFGVKPLFYYTKNGKISFSSEPITLKLLHNLRVNPLAIEEYLKFRAPIFQESFFSEVSQVKPASCLINGLYYSLEKDLHNGCGAEEPDESELEDAIRKSIASRCISDVPIGLLLSKGVDSNLIKNLGCFDRFYSVGFKGDPDFEYLRDNPLPKLALVEVDYDDFKTSFTHLLKLRGEPLSVPNEVMLHEVGRRAKADNVKVLLSGEGADEFFGGYDRIFNWAAENTFFDVAQFADKYAYGSIAKDSIIFYQLEELFKSCPFETAFEKVRWFFVKYHLPILFRRLDFSLMAAGIEGREPLANKHIFDVAKRYKVNSLMLGCANLGKEPLRSLLSKYENKKFAYEKKIGFPVDLQKIYNEPKKSSYEIWFEKNLEILK